MANAIYPKWKEYLMGGGANTDLLTEVVNVCLLDTGTVAYNSAHDFYNDISAGVVGTPVTMGSVTVTNGTVDGANVTFSSVSGATVEALVIYVKGLTDASSPLIAYLDTNVTGLPVTPNGGDITVNWDAAGIFTL